MASKVANMEVVCVEREEINTIGYFAEQLGIKKFYNIKAALNTNRKVGGCHFCTLDYSIENPDFLNSPPQTSKKNGYKVMCRETGETWISIKAASEANNFPYNAFYRYLQKVDTGENIEFEGKHYAVIEDCRKDTQ